MMLLAFAAATAIRIMDLMRIEGGSCLHTNYFRSDDQGKLMYLSRLSKQMFPYIFK
jgi:hypothetical protein